jgi:peptidyl-prolyl cis-trans isomerase C
MKATIQSLTYILLLALPLAAQVASHAPTQFAKLSGPEPAAAPDKPVVRVNGAVLTDRDLEREMATLFPYVRQHGGSIPRQLEPDIRRGALAMIEFEELVYQEALRRKMTIAPARLSRSFNEFRQQFSSGDEFQSYLKVEQQGSVQRLRDQIRRSLLIEDLLDLEVNKRAAVTERELRAEYDRNPGAFRSPEMVSIQTISIVIPDKAPEGEQAEVRHRAEEALRQARAAKDYEQFGMLAEKISEDDWHVMMGDHQLITREKMPPQVADAAFRMKPGEVSDLIRAENSWCIVRLNRYQPAAQASFDSVRAGLKSQLEKKKVEHLRAELDHKLRQNATIEEL